MGSWETICNSLHGVKPVLLMLLVQTVFSVVNIGYTLAENDGMNLQILVGYRFMFGAAFIVPVAFFVERKKRPKLTWRVAIYGFLCGLLGGSLGQNLYLKSLALTNVTFASAMMNLVPAVTFVVSVCLRLEKLGWKTAAGKAKVFGTIMGIGGAMLLTFYKGPILNLWHTNINLLELTSKHHHQMTQAHQESHNLIVGTLLALACCVCYSLWLITQAKTAESYPCPYSITAMMTLWAAIQSVVVALCTERDMSQWILGWDIRLLTVAFAGVLGAGVMFTLIAWCVRMRGPLFVSIFNPVLLVMVAIAGSLLLQQNLHLGMVLGGILIIAGLYVVLWGKGKELKKVSQLMPEDQEKQGDVEAPPPSHNVSSHGGRNGSSRGGRNGSSRGSSARKETEEETDEEKRDSHASSEILGGLYIYP